MSVITSFTLYYLNFITTMILDSLQFYAFHSSNQNQQIAAGDKSLHLNSLGIDNFHVQIVLSGPLSVAINYWFILKIFHFFLFYSQGNNRTRHRISTASNVTSCARTPTRWWHIAGSTRNVTPSTQRALRSSRRPSRVACKGATTTKSRLITTASSASMQC